MKICVTRSLFRKINFWKIRAFQCRNEFLYQHAVNALINRVMSNFCEMPIGSAGHFHSITRLILLFSDSISAHQQLYSWHFTVQWQLNKIFAIRSDIKNFGRPAIKTNPQFYAFLDTCFDYKCHNDKEWRWARSFIGRHDAESWVLSMGRMFLLFRHDMMMGRRTCVDLYRRQSRHSFSDSMKSIWMIECA
jgi:hypothetical protein